MLTDICIIRADTVDYNVGNIGYKSSLSSPLGLLTNYRLIWLPSCITSWPDQTNLVNVRLLTSVYEAVTIHRQLQCAEEEKDFLPLWFLYCIAAMNSLLVSCSVLSPPTDNENIWQIIPPQVINASSNFLIYLFAGVSFRSKFQEVFRLSQCTNSGNIGLRQEYQTNSTTRYKRF